MISMKFGPISRRSLVGLIKSLSFEPPVCPGGAMLEKQGQLLLHMEMPDCYYHVAKLGRGSGELSVTSSSAH